MISKIHLVPVVLTLHIITAGCASEPISPTLHLENYKQYVPSREVMRTLKQTDLVEIMGPPNRISERKISKGTKVLELVYFYNGKGNLASRRAKYIFLDGRYIYSLSESSFKEDSTYFDHERAKLIELGNTYAQVIELIGEPSGRLTTAGAGIYASVYSYRSHVLSELINVTIFFTSDNLVNAIWSPSKTIPNKLSEEISEEFLEKLFDFLE